VGCGHKNPTHQAREQAQPTKNHQYVCNENQDESQDGRQVFKSGKRSGIVAGFVRLKNAKGSFARDLAEGA
jgi:hypothetical protein